MPKVPPDPRWAALAPCASGLLIVTYYSVIIYDIFCQLNRGRFARFPAQQSIVSVNHLPLDSHSLIHNQQQPHRVCLSTIDGLIRVPYSPSHLNAFTPRFTPLFPKPRSVRSA